MFVHTVSRFLAVVLGAALLVGTAQASTLTVSAVSTAAGGTDILSGLATTRYVSSLESGGASVGISGVGTLTLKGAAIVSAGDHAVSLSGFSIETATDPVSGDTGSYLAVYPSLGLGSASLSFSTKVNTVSFDWGSINATNVLGVGIGGQTTYYTYSDLLSAATETMKFTVNAGDSRRVTISSADPITSLFFTSLLSTFEVRNLAIAAVPLPATALLFGTGLVGLFYLRRRRWNGASSR